MRIDVVSLFPEFVAQCAAFGVVGRAVERGLPVWPFIAGAVVLAVLGVALLGWAFAHQTGSPPAPTASPAPARC